MCPQEHIPQPEESTVNNESESFCVNTGVRQGSVLSPLLFIVYLDRVMAEVPQPVRAEYFAYADDIAQVASTKEQLERIMNSWVQAFTKYGLKLSVSKTEYMMVARGARASNLKLGQDELAYTDSFTYLGSKIESQNHMETEIMNRISKYTKNVAALYPLLREKNIPRCVKTSIYTSILRPTLIYGSETWTLTERLKNKLQAAEMRVLRLIFGVTLRDRKRNVDIRKVLKVEPIVLTIEKNILRWYGHLMRMGPSRRVKQVATWKPTGKRPVGRPRKRWMDGVEAILKRVETTRRQAEILCQDRKRWRELVRHLSTDRLT